MTDPLSRLACELPTDAQALRLLQRGEAYRAGSRLSTDAERRTEEVDERRDTAASRRHEVSPREREDDARRDEREFGPFVCENPFEAWIQDVIDGKGVWHED